MLIPETMSLRRMLIKDPLTPPTATQLTTAKQTTANHPPLPPQLQWERLRTILSTLATMMGFMAYGGHAQFRGKIPRPRKSSNKKAPRRGNTVEYPALSKKWRSQKRARIEVL